MRREVIRTPLIAKLILASIVVAPALVSQAQRNRPRKNHVPSIQSFNSSKKEIDLCPFVPSGSCSSSGTIATLEVGASDPDDDRLSYKYSVSAGTIVGSGATVNWDLTQSRLGTQTASVEVTDQRGGKVVGTTTIQLVSCGACDPPCPTLSVSCPSSVTEGEIAIFEATVGGDPAGKLTYLWGHSNGTRFPEQQGPTLRIRAVGLPGDIITATVDVLGFDPACNRQASCESRIVKRTPGPAEK